MWLRYVFTVLVGGIIVLGGGVIFGVPQLLRGKSSSTEKGDPRRKCGARPRPPSRNPPRRNSRRAPPPRAHRKPKRSGTPVAGTAAASSRSTDRTRRSTSNKCENKDVKNEVLTRIDLMPGISQGNKDKLYQSVQRARSMGKVLTIPFGSGRTEMSQRIFKR